LVRLCNLILVLRKLIDSTRYSLTPLQQKTFQGTRRFYAPDAEPVLVAIHQSQFLEKYRVATSRQVVGWVWEISVGVPDTGSFDKKNRASNECQPNLNISKIIHR